MRGKLKTLELTLLAAFAASAVMASAAQALSQGQFTSVGDVYPTVITGNQEGTENFYQTRSDKFSCTTAEYESTLSTKGKIITVTPHYAGCTNSGGAGSTYTLNGCHFTFEAQTYTGAGDETTHGTAGIKCPPGQSITITGPGGICIVHIPEQTSLTTVTFTNKPAGGVTPDPWVTVDVNIHNTTYDETDNSFFCPFSGDFHGSDGKLVAKIVLKGYNDTGNEVTGAGSTTPGVTHYLHNASRGIHVK
jgi:hypothetical protein